MSGCSLHSDDTMEQVPMNRYSNPIPTCCPSKSRCCQAQQEGIDHILTALAWQNQILIDLLGAINGLTAALLCEKK